MAMCTLQQAIAAVAAVAEAQTGVRKAPQYPPGQLPVFPYVVTYAGPSEWFGATESGRKALHTIVCEFHVAEIEMARSVEKVMPYADTFPLALLDDVLLGGVVSTINAVRSSGFIPLGWDKSTVGIRFEIDVKIQETG